MKDAAWETIRVSSLRGNATVRCRVWRHLPYVARPVDAEYQSLDVFEPVEMNGCPVDCRRAPILLSIRVMGYMGVRNHAGGAAAPLLPPPPPPPGGRRQEEGSRFSPSDEQALAAGLVVVIPGCRGRDTRAADGRWIGKAPAAIVDLKAAVRFLRAHRDSLPGDPERIVSYGLSAGGALSALLGASGDDAAFAPYLRELGAAETSDTLLASACFCPIMDLEHQDMAHEWMRGRQPCPSGTLVDQTLSAQLVAENESYQKELALVGRGFGPITAETYGAYLTSRYLNLAASAFLRDLPEAPRTAYLQDRPWLDWDGTQAAFSFDAFCAYSGRMKGLPACDSFDLTTAENSLFGDETTDAAHFTTFSLRHATGDAHAELSPALAERVRAMNPMTFLRADCPGAVRHWWLRCGALERGASLSILTNFALLAEQRGMEVDYRYYWDRGHAVDDDPDQLFAWIKKIQ